MVSLLAGTGVWATKDMPGFQEESVELKVPDGSIVTGFRIATLGAPCSHIQMRIDEVKLDDAIGTTIFEWKHCGMRSLEELFDWSDSSGYTPSSIAVPVTITTNATRFKVSVRHTFVGINSRGINGAQAGVAIFRVLGVAA